jgi:hypothetical protein
MIFSGFWKRRKRSGDVYFVFKEKGVNEKQIAAKVKSLLNSESVVYQEKYKLSGEVAPHTFDFYIPPNGNRALALAILSAHALLRGANRAVR